MGKYKCVEKPMLSKTILFSGRFDRPHLGHIVTIARLGQRFEKVIVCILDYPNQFYPIKDRVKIMKDALQHMNGHYEIITNKQHFAHIDKEDLENLPSWDVYGSGNYECFMHVGQLGFDSISVPRYPGYAASSDVKYQRLINFLDENGILSETLH